MKGKKAAVISLGLLASGLAIVILFLPPVRNRIIEEWYLRKLDSSDRIERHRAAERLAEVGSLRAIPKLVALFPTEYGDNPPRWVPQVLLRLGSTGIGAAFRLKLPDGRVHPDVFEAFRELGPNAKEAIPFLVACLRSSEDGLDAAFTLQGLGHEAVAPLIRALAEADVEGRSNAAYALGRLESVAVPAVPALAKTLKDQEARVRKAAAEALGAIGSPAQAAVPELITALQKDQEDDVREEAAKALGKIGPEAKLAIPALVEALDPKSGAENAAAEALAGIDPVGTAVGPLLLKKLADLPRDEPRRIWALFWALDKFAGRSPEVGKALIERSHDEDPEIRQQATQALSEFKTEAARTRLFELLKDRDRKTRFFAAFSLARQQVFPDEAIPVFIEALCDKGGGNRSNAACYLKDFGARAAPAIPHLIACLKDREAGSWSQKALVATKDAIGENIQALAALLDDKDGEVRERVAEVMAQIGPAAAPAVPQLVNALSHSDDVTRREAMEAIAAIGPGAKEAIPELVKILGDPGWALDQEPQDYAVQALVFIGPASVPALLEAIGDPQGGVRSGVARALGGLPASPEVMAALIRTLGDGEPVVRAAASYALRRIGKGSGESMNALKVLLKDPEAEVRISSAAALRSLGIEAGVVLPVLIALLDDPDPERRRRACNVIEEMGPPAEPAVLTLIRMLKDEDRGVVEAAAMALGKIGRGARSALPALHEIVESLQGSPITPFVQGAIEEIEK